MLSKAEVEKRKRQAERKKRDARRKADAKKKRDAARKKKMTERGKTPTRDADGVYRRTLGGKGSGYTATWAGW